MNRFSSTRRMPGCEHGGAIVEFALITPILLIIMLGVVEFGRAFEFMHAVSGLSRESANLASRGSSLQETVTSALATGADISLQAKGGVIASRIARQGNSVVVQDQVASAGYAGLSRVGGPGMAAGDLAALPFANGQTAYVVEVFYPYQPVTPLSTFAKYVFPSTLYSRSVF